MDISAIKVNITDEKIRNKVGNQIKNNFHGAIQLDTRSFMVNGSPCTVSNRLQSAGIDTHTCDVFEPLVTA